MKQIEITCRGADLLPIDVILEFQGNLKKISKENIDKLKRAIVKYGFTAPVFVWQNAGDNFILDGHQRIKALIEMRQEGYNIPMLPVDYIEAADEAEAKAKLLHITSQYGEFTTDGYIEFTAGIEFEPADIRLTEREFITHARDIDVDSFFGESDAQRAQKEKTCPHCGGVL